MKKIYRNVDVLWQFGWATMAQGTEYDPALVYVHTAQSLNKNLGLRQDYLLLLVGSYPKPLKETFWSRWQEFGPLARPQFLDDHVGKFARTRLP
jgi:hypothetical protein